MASRGFRICGSGTFSTRTSFLPCQQTALIVTCSSLRCGREDLAERGTCTVRLPAVGRDLAGLHQVLEAAKVARHLFLGLLAEEFGDGGSKRARGRAVDEVDVNLGASSTRCRHEAH